MTTISRKSRQGGVSPRLTFAALAAACMAACAGPANRSAEAPAPRAIASAPVPAEANPLGIQVTALRLSAGGFMVDLRYRVVDAERARLLLDKRTPTYLVDEATGLKYAVPNTAKLGRLRAGAQSVIHTDRDYGMLFGNPGHQLKPGTAVTLVAGEAALPHLIVQ